MNSPTSIRPVTAAVVGCLLLAGCSTDGATPIAPPSSVASTGANASASASPTPSSTLTAAQQQAIDETSAVVVAYEQMFYDLQADSDPYLNDINSVATAPQLDLDLLSLRQAVVLVAQGKKVVESTGPVTLATVDPVKVSLKSDPATVTLEVCIDKTATRSTYKGKVLDTTPQLARYRVVKTTYLPAPGWAVAKVLPPRGHDQPQPC